jgi:hypothetical protein
VAAQPIAGERPFLAARLAGNEHLRERVAAARQLGISLRRFDGWEAQQVTEYEHDERGLLVRSVTTQEPEWDEEQQGWVLALAMWESFRCKQCGGDLHETAHPDNDPGNPHGKGVYRALPPAECYQCTALHAARSDPAYAKDKRALIHRVELQPRGAIQVPVVGRKRQPNAGKPVGKRKNTGQPGQTAPAAPPA